MDRRTLLASALGLTATGAALRIGRLDPRTSFASGGEKGSAAMPARPGLAGGAIKSVSLAQVPLGAGGFITGMDISSDGQRLVCRTDVANAYIRDRNDAFWRPLFSPDSMRLRNFDDIPDSKDKADANGAAGVRIAPSNKNVIYASFHGFVWKSSDGGKTLALCGLPQKTMHTNRGVQRLFNRTIDVHPRDAERVVVGTWGEGVWHSANGGKDWAEAALPRAGKSTDDQPGVALIAYDPTAPDRLYVFLTGLGLFCSETGAAGSFRHLEGGPSAASELVSLSDGTVLVCEHTKAAERGSLFRYSPTNGWSSAKPPYEAVTIAVDPRRPSRAILINPNGFFMESNDGCLSFKPVGGGHFETGGEVAWVAGLKTLFPSQLMFDPVAPDQLWVAQGVGVATTKAGSREYRLRDWSAGIEELGTTSIAVPAGGKPVISAWDKPFWRVESLTHYENSFTYPVPAGTEPSVDLVAFGSNLDVAPENSSFMIGVVAPNGSGPGYSLDGGTTWRIFEGVPTTGWGNGGVIAAGSVRNFVLLPSNNGVGAFTLDGGKSWEPIKLDGVTPTAGFANAFYTPRRNLSADKSRPGTFALVYTVVRNNEFQEPLGGVWLTSDGGRSWRQTLKGTISAGNHDPRSVSQSGQDPRQFWACQLSYVPGHSGELLYTSHADFKDDRFFWSRDDGANWVEPDRRIRNVTSFGFGKPAAGQARPSLVFSGEIDGKKGIFATLDWFATPPILLARFPSETLSEVSCIAGDPNEFGRFYAGLASAGCVRIDFTT